MTKKVNTPTNNNNNNLDELLIRVRSEINKQINASYNYQSNNSLSLRIAQNKLLLGQAKKLLKSAQVRTIARTKWPDKLSKFPLSISLIFKPLVLKTLAALFKDQREINNSLIAACNLSLLLNEKLLEELENLHKKPEVIDSNT